MREVSGGFEDRFRVTRTDGEPVREDAHYFVMDYASDPHARKAIRAYAKSISVDNPKLAHDLIDAVVYPEKYPKQHD